MPKMEVGEKGFFRRRGTPSFSTGEGDDGEDTAAELMLMQTYSATPEAKGSSSGGSVRYTPLGQVLEVET